MTKKKAKSASTITQALRRSRQDGRADLVSENAALRAENRRLMRKIEHLEYENAAIATLNHNLARRRAYGETMN